MLNELKKCEYGGHNFLFPVRQVNLHAMLVNCGWRREERCYDWRGLNRGANEFAIWQYTVSGRGRLDIDGTMHDLTPGKALLVHVPQNHRYFLPPDSDHWEFLFITMNGRELMRLWFDIGKITGGVAEFASESVTVSTAVEIYKLGIDGKINTPFIASDMAYRMLMAVYEDLAPQNDSGKSRPEFVTRVIEYCLNNLQKDLSVDDLAEVAGFSRYHFTRQFTAFQGTSPAAFLRELRMKRAFRMLQMENSSVKEIAERCGFKDESYFCKVFRRTFSMSPMEFRHSESH